MKSIGCHLCETKEPTFASVPIDKGKAKRAKISDGNTTDRGGLAVLSHAAEGAAMSFVEGLSHDVIQAQGLAPTIIAAESIAEKCIATSLHFLFSRPHFLYQYMDDTSAVASPRGE